MTRQVQFMSFFSPSVLYSGAVMSDPVSSLRASLSLLLFEKTKLVFLSKCQHGISSVLGRQWCSLHTITQTHPDIRNIHKHASTHLFMHTHRNPGPKAFLSQNCQFHEAELIHCTFLESASLFSPPLLSFFSLLSSSSSLFSNSLISLSSPSASFTLTFCHFSPHSPLPPLLFWSILHFTHLLIQYVLFSISILLGALLPLPSLCITPISSFPSCKHLMDSDVQFNSHWNWHKTSYDTRGKIQPRKLVNWYFRKIFGLCF